MLCLMAQSCPTLCDPMDSSPPGSSLHGISQARILKWVAFPGDLPDPGLNPSLLCLLLWQADSLPLHHLLDFSVTTGKSTLILVIYLGFPGASDGKESACNAGDLGSTPGLGRSPEEGTGNPLQYSRLENPHGQGSLAGYSLWGGRV